MGKHFIDPKSSEILSIFQVFPCTVQIALFWTKLLPALFLKKPWYPCPYEILEEALHTDMTIHWKALEENFPMVPLVFWFTHVCGRNVFWRNVFSEFFSKNLRSQRVKAELLVKMSSCISLTIKVGVTFIKYGPFLRTICIFLSMRNIHITRGKVYIFLFTWSPSIYTPLDKI
jgi:hypothetical protein